MRPQDAWPIPGGRIRHGLAPSPAAGQCPPGPLGRDQSRRRHHHRRRHLSDPGQHLHRRSAALAGPWRVACRRTSGPHRGVLLRRAGEHLSAFGRRVCLPLARLRSAATAGISLCLDTVDADPAGINCRACVCRRPLYRRSAGPERWADAFGALDALSDGAYGDQHRRRHLGKKRTESTHDPEDRWFGRHSCRRHRLGADGEPCPGRR